MMATRTLALISLGFLLTLQLNEMKANPVSSLSGMPSTATSVRHDLVQVPSLNTGFINEFSAKVKLPPSTPPGLRSQPPQPQNPWETLTPISQINAPTAEETPSGSPQSFSEYSTLTTESPESLESHVLLEKTPIGIRRFSIPHSQIPILTISRFNSTSNPVDIALERGIGFAGKKRLQKHEYKNHDGQYGDGEKQQRVEPAMVKSSDGETTISETGTGKQLRTKRSAYNHRDKSRRRRQRQHKRKQAQRRRQKSRCNKRRH